MSALLFDTKHLKAAVFFELILLAIWMVCGIFFFGLLLTFVAGTIMMICILRNIYRWLDAKEAIDRLSSSHAYLKKSNELIKEKSSDPSSIYLGKGFVWENSHVQQYYDLSVLPERKKYLDLETKAGGYEYIHALERKDDTIKIDRNKLQHTVIAGTTGTGKTKVFDLLISQLCADEPTIIVDPKGDEELLDGVYDACVEHGIEDRFSFFSLAHPSASVGFNPLSSYGGPSDVADRIVSIMPTGSGDQAFRNFAWQVMEIVASAMMGVQETITLEKLQYYSMDDMQALVTLCEDKIPKLPADLRNFAIKSLGRLKVQAGHPKEHYQKMITSLGPILTSLNSGDIAPLLNAEPENSIQWRDVVSKKKVIYFDLASMLRQEVANNVGKMIVQDVLYFMGEIYAYEASENNMNLFIDEFYSVMFKGYIDMLNKSRGAGLRMILGMQTSADIANAMGDGKDSYIRQVLGNLNNKIYLRIPEPNLADEFSKLFGNTYVRNIDVMQTEASRSAWAGALFGSSVGRRSTNVEIPKIPPDLLMHLPIGQAFAYIQGRDPYKIRFPLIERPPENKNHFSKTLKSSGMTRIDTTNLPSWVDFDGSKIEWPEEKINV